MGISNETTMSVLVTAIMDLESTQRSTVQPKCIVKHVKSKTTEMDNNPDTNHNSVYRRRRPSKTRCVAHNKTSLENLPSHGQDEERISSPKSKSRRHLRKEIERLAEENHALTNKLEDSNDNAEIVEQIKQKDLVISKLCNKCDKLAKEKENMKTEVLKLNSILEEHETNTLKQFEKEKTDFYVFHQKVKSENLQLNEDVTLLKNLVYRLNVELERYQDKLREHGQSVPSLSPSNLINQLEPMECDKTILQSWGRVDKHALGPLLNAYQQNLTEKEELIVKYGQEMEEFSGRCKEVLIENENLQKEIANLKSQIEIHQKEIETIVEDAVIVKEQNDLLTKQAILHKQKLQDIHTIYEQKVESMSQDNNKLYKDYISCKTELGNVLGKYEILNEGYEKFKSNTEKTMPVSVHNAAVEECRRLFEELKSQYGMEKKKLSLQITQLQESQPDIEKQLITVTAERNQAKIFCKTLEKNLKRTQNKLEHLQSNMCSLQVSRDSFKRQLNKTMSYCEELVSEYEKVLSEKNKLSTLLKDREKENANIHYLGDNISQRMGHLKSQLKNVQKGATSQLSIVEKHMKIQETEFNQLKSEYCREVERLKNLVKRKEDIIGKLQREKFATQDNLELVWKAASNDDRKVKDALKNTTIVSLSKDLL